jgi:protein involved in polysaccharide export with SLBB domain
MTVLSPMPISRRNDRVTPTTGCNCGGPHRAALLTPLLCALAAGCAPFQRPLASTATAASTKLSWLTQWVAAPLESSPGFDPEVLKTPPRTRQVAADDLLEVTVWDLYEPGKPHTYPVRVSRETSIEAPLLGEISVANLSPSEIERTLAAQYREREILLHPRLLVRSLDAPTLKVRVSGAVMQPGFVEIPRDEPTVYTALLSAGGLRKNAGAQIGIQRRREPASKEDTSSYSGSEFSEFEPAAATEPSPSAAPVSLANSIEVLSVNASTVAIDPEGSPSDAHSVVRTPGEFPAVYRLSLEANRAGPESGGEEGCRWYDLSRDIDVEALRDLVLCRGDEIVVKSAAPPVRISGLVHRPGPYAVPTGRKINVWQALDLAGGVTASDVPLNFTLYRPAGEGHGSQRWYLPLDSFDRRPAASPTVEPGDILHVEPTTASRIKRAVGDLWNKP